MNFILVTSQGDENLNENLNDSFIVKTLSKYFNSSIDNLIVHSLKPNNITKYTIDEVKAFIKSSYLTSSANYNKVFIIYNFDLFTDIHQNFILKTLEENKNTFILVTSSLDKILPTVISRCITVYSNYDKNNNDNDEILNINLFEIKKFFEDKNITREDLLTYLKNLIINQKIFLDNYYNILIIDKLIKLVEANCSIKSIYFYFDYIINKIPKNV